MHRLGASGRAACSSWGAVGGVVQPEPRGAACSCTALVSGVQASCPKASSMRARRRAAQYSGRKSVGRRPQGRPRRHSAQRAVQLSPAVCVSPEGSTACRNRHIHSCSCELNRLAGYPHTTAGAAPCAFHPRASGSGAAATRLTRSPQCWLVPVLFSVATMPNVCHNTMTQASVKLERKAAGSRLA